MSYGETEVSVTSSGKNSFRVTVPVDWARKYKLTPGNKLVVKKFPDHLEYWPKET